jgi:hypothetical protein
MKLFFSILLLQAISIASICQSNNQSVDHREKLDQYLWSYAKNEATAKRPLVDFDGIDDWRGMGYHLAVSDDGRYFSYTINKNHPEYLGSPLTITDSVIVQSTKNKWRRVFAGAEEGFFTVDGKQYIFKNGGALCFLLLGNEKQKLVNDVASFKTAQNKWLAYQLKGSDSLTLQNLATGREKTLSGITNFNFDGSGQWLICKNNNADELLLYNLASGVEKRFSNVSEYIFSASGGTLLLKTMEKSNSSLQYVDLLQPGSKAIWKTNGKSGIKNVSIDASGKRVVFSTTDSVDASQGGAWYYEAGMDKAVLKISNSARGIPAGCSIVNVSFTDNYRYLKCLFQSKPDVVVYPDKNIAGLEVWNHKDLNLQSVQSSQLYQFATYYAIARIEDGSYALSENDNKKIALISGDFALVKNDYNKEMGDRFWEQKEDSCWVVSLKDGSSKLLNTKSDRYWFSPDGNYLVYFDNKKGCHYFSYDLNSGVAKDISDNVPENQLGLVNRENDQAARGGNLAAWLENNANVLVYDNYDIWKLDLTGKRPAVNITNGFGLATGTILNLFTTDRSSGDVPMIKANEALQLRGYNANNKQSGFYKKRTTKVGGIPDKLYMGDYFMNGIGNCQDPNLSNRGIAPSKAKNDNTWIVQRQSANDAPNYYETSDFKTFRRLTDFQPQRNYQWLTNEIVSFAHLDGKTGHGVLYKPENFDAKRKYPVLITFYGAFSNNMHQFRIPTYLNQAMGTGMSPIWFLNNGYLVFAIDMAVTPLKPGPKALSVMEGAIRYLKQLPYVDANRLGCGSHSRSARLGAYIFTHSKSFAATAISEGFTYGNAISMALSPFDGISRLNDVENGAQYGNLWENKESWLDQTTVLNVDKAKSPVLLLCNKESSKEYQDQTFQFFNALRRLDKDVWWLKYDNESHSIFEKKDLRDYTTRYTQFFDHYLKYAPAPQWMTRGIPYKLKGLESRYELDPQGTCNSPNGEPCPICEAWNTQYNKTPQMFQKEIKDWTLDKDIETTLEQKISDRRKLLDKEGEIQTKQVMEMLNR